MSSPPPDDTRPGSPRIVRFIVEIPDAPFKPLSPTTEIAHARIQTALDLNGLDRHTLELQLQASLQIPLSIIGDNQAQNLNQSQINSQEADLVISIRMLDILHGRAPPPAEPTLHDFAASFHAEYRAAQNSHHDSSDDIHNYGHRLDTAIEDKYRAWITWICREGRRNSVQYELLSIMLAMAVRERVDREREREREMATHARDLGRRIA